MDSNVVRFKTHTPYKKADDFVQSSAQHNALAEGTGLWPNFTILFYQYSLSHLNASSQFLILGML